MFGEVFTVEAAVICGACTFAGIYTHELSHYVTAKSLKLSPKISFLFLRPSSSSSATDTETRLVGIAPFIVAIISAAVLVGFYQPVPLAGWAFLLGLLIFTSASDLSVTVARSGRWEVWEKIPVGFRVFGGGLLTYWGASGLVYLYWAGLEVSRLFLVELSSLAEMAGVLVMVAGMGWAVLRWDDHFGRFNPSGPSRD